MSRDNPASGTSARRPEDDAAGWVARLRAEDCSNEDWRQFCDWRDEDSTNRDAFAKHMEIWTSLDAIADEPEIVRMRLDALSLEAAPTARRAWLLPLAASFVLMLASGLLVLAAWNGIGTGSEDGRFAVTGPTRAVAADGTEAARGPAHERFAHRYSSAVGQRSRIDLPDGSVMELNTDTVVDVNFTLQRRELRLVRGEALFDVFPDASRPFIVNSEDERVIALGTMFSVRKIGGQVVVSLFEGSVQVQRLADSSSGAKAVQSTRLNPGEQLISSGARDFEVSPVDGDRALGWRSGKLVFDGDRLGDVVAELNRYSVRKLALGDPELGKLKVSGAFRTGSAETFASALSVALPISVATERESGRIVLYAAKK